jgi:hypothetical protein
MQTFNFGQISFTAFTLITANSTEASFRTVAEIKTFVQSPVLPAPPYTVIRRCGACRGTGMPQNRTISPMCGGCHGQKQWRGYYETKEGLMADLNGLPVF